MDHHINLYFWRDCEIWWMICQTWKSWSIHEFHKYYTIFCGQKMLKSICIINILKPHFMVIVPFVYLIGHDYDCGNYFLQKWFVISFKYSTISDFSMILDPQKAFSISALRSKVLRVGAKSLWKKVSLSFARN